MVVNSLAFLWFFLFVIVVYYLCQTKKEVQNVFLLGYTYWFYSQVDIRMTGLLWIKTEEFPFPIHQQKQQLLKRFIQECQAKAIQLCLIVSPMYICIEQDMFRVPPSSQRKFVTIGVISSTTHVGLNHNISA